MMIQNQDDKSPTARLHGHKMAPSQLKVGESWLRESGFKSPQAAKKMAVGWLGWVDWRLEEPRRLKKETLEPETTNLWIEKVGQENAIDAIGNYISELVMMSSSNF